MSYQKAEETAKATGRYILRLGSVTMAMFAVDGWRYAAAESHLTLANALSGSATIIVCTAAALFFLANILHFYEWTIARTGKMFVHDLPFFILGVIVDFGYMEDCIRYPLLWWISIVTIIAWLAANTLRAAFHVAPRVADYKATFKEVGTGLRQIWRKHHGKSNDE